jgi:uncharacterized protein YggE
MRLGPIVFFSSLLLQACNAAAPVKESVPHISVTGSASEDVAPDQAIIFFSVVTERPSAEEAATENAKAMKAVVDELKTHGVDAKEIQTIGVSLAPYSTEERDPRSGAARRAQKGFRARNDAKAAIKTIDNAGRIAQQIVDKGANAIQDIVFDLSDVDSHLDRLRAEAMKNAKRQAEIYVEAIGLKLGKALEIAPGPDETQAPRPFQAREGLAAAKAAPDGFPVEPGLRKLTARVTVTWAIAR